MGVTLALRKARNMALVVLCGMVLGNLLLESGNIVTYAMATSDHHLFNDFMGLAGLLGLFIYGIALVRRRGVYLTVVRKTKRGRS